MSFTPLDGLLMGTRAGAIDPGVVLYLLRHEQLTPDQVERLLVHESMTKSMQGDEPSDADLDAMMAYLATLDFKPNPHRNPDGSLTAAQTRGEAVFKAKGCDTCHASPTYTSSAAYVVGLEAPEDVYRGYNPPTLRGVYNRSPYLHTSAAQTLEEVLTEYHRPSKLTGKPDCTPSELADLTAFLKAL